jgi:uncharacterized repeat protein (TIGR03843 family)
MEIHIVPTTILRDGPFGVGMVQEWIDIDPDVDLAEYFARDEIQLRKMALFDAIINNTDRKIGHLLPRNDGKLFGCDHGVTFHSENKLRTVLWQWAGSELMLEEIDALKKLLETLKSTDGDRLADLITDVELDALYDRI